MAVEVSRMGGERSSRCTSALDREHRKGGEEEGATTPKRIKDEDLGIIDPRRKREVAVCCWEVSCF